MNKQLLTFVSVSVLALVRPAASLIAAPAPGSAEQADRQFLANLENSDATKSAPAEPSAPPADTNVQNPAPQERPVQAKTSPPAKKKTEVAKSSDREAATLSQDVNRKEPAPPAATKKMATYARSATRERVSQPQDAAEREALQTAPIKKAKDDTRNSSRERVVQPAEVADTGPAVPDKSKSRTVMTVRSTDRDHDNDQNHDRGDEHNFFHRLFHHGSSEHPEE
jgi:hypothetical protein